MVFELRSLFLRLFIIVTCCAQTSSSFSFSVSPILSRKGWNPSSHRTNTITIAAASSSSQIAANINLWKKNRRCCPVIRNAIVDSSTLANDGDMDPNFLDINLDEIPPAADFIDPSETWVASAVTSTSTTRREDSTVGKGSTDFSSSSVDASSTAPITAAATSNTYVRCGVCSSHFAITPEDLGGERSKGRRLECSVCGNVWFQSKDRILKLRPGMELVALPAMDLERVRRNREEGKPLNFVGDAKLYVGNLSFDCTEQLLYETFSEFGTVGEISMVYDNDTGRPRGFAFVTMRTRTDAQNLLQQQGAALQIMGRELSIREANT